jgi:hypothetical protein
MGGSFLTPGCFNFELSTKVMYPLVGKVVGGAGEGEGSVEGVFCGSGPPWKSVPKYQGGAGAVDIGSLSAVAETPTSLLKLPMNGANKNTIGGFIVTVIALLVPPFNDEKLTLTLAVGMEIPEGP